jgi:hypothetical protein
MFLAGSWFPKERQEEEQSYPLLQDTPSDNSFLFPLVEGE